ncbi:MAG: hypothetical protein O7G84_13445, partial [Gammaproteobacteria bacterium]|nr:hypothetical protein [Gammaproteobacteria bacterium]
RERILEVVLGWAQDPVPRKSTPGPLFDRAVAEIYGEFDLLRRLNDPSHLYLLCEVCRLR